MENAKWKTGILKGQSKKKSKAPTNCVNPKCAVDRVSAFQGRVRANVGTKKSIRPPKDCQTIPLVWISAPFPAAGRGAPATCTWGANPLLARSRSRSRLRPFLRGFTARSHADFFRIGNRDVINDFDFPEADQLLKYARPMARNLLHLKRRAQKAGAPIIYVNDNFGRWKSDFRRTVDHCERRGRGRDVVRLLRPEENDYFVLKPKHSGFFSTALETLLRYLETETLVLTGIAGNICVLFTANDAYMRDFDLWVPSDCTVSNTKRENEEALRLMRRFLKADTRPASKIEFDER